MDTLVTFFACEIPSCDPLRIGVTVNLAFLVIGFLVLVMMHVALKPRDQVTAVLKGELHGQLSHFGYSLYLVAGSGFFGSLPFSSLLLSEHSAFALSWAIILVVLLLIEMTKARFVDASPTFSLSRILAIPCAVAFCYWVWTGAKWLEG
jgi:hypothetical protein